VTQEVRFVDTLRDELRLTDLTELSPRRTIRPGEVLTLRDFEEQVGNDQAQQLIRTRDSVRITGVRKGLKFVVPAAEAMQSGRKGQLIRVKNLHSNKVVVARVVGRGEVEVPLQ